MIIEIKNLPAGQKIERMFVDITFDSSGETKSVAVETNSVHVETKTVPVETKTVPVETKPVPVETKEPRDKISAPVEMTNLEF